MLPNDVLILPQADRFVQDNLQVVLHSSGVAPRRVRQHFMHLSMHGGDFTSSPDATKAMRIIAKMRTTVIVLLEAMSILRFSSSPRLLN